MLGSPLFPPLLSSWAVLALAAVAVALIVVGAGMVMWGLRAR